jgi:hypothetical protein
MAPRSDVAHRLRATLLNRHRWAWIALVASAVGAGAWLPRVVADPNRARFKAVMPDSFDYLRIATESPTSLSEFWLGQRPFVYPALLWLMGGNTTNAVIVQSILYVIAVLYLLTTLVRCAQSRVVGIAAAGVALVLLTGNKYGQWPVNLLSESIAHTLAIAMIAAWIRLASWPSGRRAVIAGLFTCLWALSRDGNSAVGLLGAVGVLALLAIWSVVDRRAKRSASRQLTEGDEPPDASDHASDRAPVSMFLRPIAVAVLLCGMFTLVAQRVSDRDRYWALNVIGVDVLPDPELREWFIDKGMPNSPALLARSGRDAWSDGNQSLLTNPELVEFRQWANGPGQRVLFRSFVQHAPHHLGRLTRDWENWRKATKHDAYDAFRATDRTPKVPGAGWLTSLPLHTLLVVAIASLALAAVFRARSRLVLVGWMFLGTAFVEVYLGFVGDGVERWRHTIGGQLRLDLAVLFAVFLLVDSAVYWARTRRRSQAEIVAESVALPEPPKVLQWSALGVWLTSATASLLVVGAIFRNQYNAADWDPQYMRDIVERTMRFGGSYYENGIHNKGPLEPVVYHLAAVFSTYATYWFAIAFVAALSAVATGWAATVVTRKFDRSTAYALGAAASVFIHFSLTGADYSGKLYSRNITIGLLSVAAAVMFSGRLARNDSEASSSSDAGSRLASARSWLSNRRWLIIVGLCLGLSVQTVSTTALSVSVLGVSALYLIGNREGGSHIRLAGVRSDRRFLIMISALTFFSAPVWYLLRGQLDLYWASWWTYGTYMTEATGKSLRKQLSVGFHDQWIYYRDRPMAVIAGVVFVALLLLFWRSWSRVQRVMQATLILWFLAASVEIILTQRNSTHYYAVSAVPLALAFVGVGAQLLAAIRRSGAQLRWAPVVPAAITFATFMLTGTGPLRDGFATAAGYRGERQQAQRRLDNQDAATGRTVQATLDLVSSDDDPMLLWTSEPWDYLSYRRVSATRFIWKTFLMGEIYLGKTSPDYILPGSWDWYADDVRESNPVAALDYFAKPVAPGTPAETLLQNSFTEAVRTDKARVLLRNDVFNVLTKPASSSTSVALTTNGPSNWTLQGDTASYAVTNPSAPGAANDALSLGSSPCTMLNGTLATLPDGSNGRVVFRFMGLRNGTPVETRLALEGAQATAGDSGAAFLSQQSGAVPGTPTEFRVVIGHRSAALIVNGFIRAAVAIPSGAAISVEARAESVGLSNLQTAPYAGCPPPPAQ